VVEGAHSIDLDEQRAWQSQLAPTTMLRMVPLPRCAGEDAQANRYITEYLMISNATPSSTMPNATAAIGNSALIARGASR
jgi:hypothetical protein